MSLGYRLTPEAQANIDEICAFIDQDSVDAAHHGRRHAQRPVQQPESADAVPNALQEFKVETSALPARYGYHAASAVNLVTKSGSNLGPR